MKEAVQEEIENTRGYRPTLNQILILPGGKPRVYFTMITPYYPRDEIIYLDLGFPSYKSISRYIGAKGVSISLKEENGFRLNPKDIATKINMNTKLIILNSPQNPTRSVM